MTRLEEIEKQYGVRTRIPMAHGEPLLTHHFRGELDNGDKFVYCPVGYIASWLTDDYTHKYCPWCKGFFNELASVTGLVPTDSDTSKDSSNSPINRDGEV